MKKRIDNVVISDSSAKLFGILDNTEAEILSGRTMKNITKKDSDMVKKIKKIVSKYKKYKLKYFIISFGTVDLHFSLYYDLFIKTDREWGSVKEAMEYWKKTEEPIIKTYVEKISKIKTGKTKKMIFGVTQPPQKQEYILGVLKKYLYMDFSEKVSDNNLKILKELAASKLAKNRTDFMNNQIKKECDKHKIPFYDFTKHLKTPTGNYREKYIDISPLNSHILHEQVILDLIKYPFFKDILDMKLSPKKLKKIMDDNKKYIKYKKRLMSSLKKKDRISIKGYGEMKNKYISKYVKEK